MVRFAGSNCSGHWTLDIGLLLAGAALAGRTAGAGIAAIAAIAVVIRQALAPGALAIVVAVRALATPGDTGNTWRTNLAGRAAHIRIRIDIRCRVTGTAAIHHLFGVAVSIAVIRGGSGADVHAETSSRIELLPLRTTADPASRNTLAGRRIEIRSGLAQRNTAIDTELRSARARALAVRRIGAI